MPRETDYSRPYLISDPASFRLGDIDPAETRGVRSREHADEILAKGIASLTDLQDRLYAQDQWALLLIFQAMDAASKDSTIKHVMSGANPQACQVYSFKAPSSEELNHDFLWRTTRCLPERGRIGIFNRSYYEEVLVVRVHPGILHQQRVPPGLIGKNLWKERFEDINGFERYISRNGLLVRKFFLHVSRDEQRKRFLERLDRVEKHWKFSLSDLEERHHWDEYMDAYEEAIRRTSTPHAPWYVVPADHKWFTRLVVAEAVVSALRGLGLEYPEVPPERVAEFDAARKALLSEETDPPPKKRRG